MLGVWVRSLERRSWGREEMNVELRPATSCHNSPLRERRSGRLRTNRRRGRSLSNTIPRIVFAAEIGRATSISSFGFYSILAAYLFFVLFPRCLVSCPLFLAFPSSPPLTTYYIVSYTQTILRGRPGYIRETAHCMVMWVPVMVLDVCGRFQWGRDLLPYGSSLFGSCW